MAALHLSGPQPRVPDNARCWRVAGVTFSVFVPAAAIRGSSAVLSGAIPSILMVGPAGTPCFGTCARRVTLGRGNAAPRSAPARPPAHHARGQFATVEEAARALGLTSTSVGPKEVKRSFRKLALQHHPDVSGQDDGAEFMRISLAYEIVLGHALGKDVEALLADAERASSSSGRWDFHDWYWSFRRSRMRKRKGDASGTTQQPRGGPELEAQLQGMRERASRRAGEWERRRGERARRWDESHRRRSGAQEAGEGVCGRSNSVGASGESGRRGAAEDGRGADVRWPGRRGWHGPGLSAAREEGEGSVGARVEGPGCDSKLDGPEQGQGGSVPRHVSRQLEGLHRKARL